MENKELFAALSKFQGEVKNAIFDKTNPFFNGAPYASLTSVWDTIRIPLAKNGLSIEQRLYSSDANHYINTWIRHSSGQSMDSGCLRLVVEKQTMHSLGSAITYFKRAQLCAALGIVGDADLDGEQPTDPKAKASQSSSPAPLVRPQNPAAPTKGSHGPQEKKAVAQLYAVVDKKKCAELMPRLIQALFGKDSTADLVMRELTELTDLVASNDVDMLEKFLAG